MKIDAKLITDVMSSCKPAPGLAARLGGVSAEFEAERDQWEFICHVFAAQLRVRNNKFDKPTFFKACGLEEEPRK